MLYYYKDLVYSRIPKGCEDNIFVPRLGYVCQVVFFRVSPIPVKYYICTKCNNPICPSAMNYTDNCPFCGAKLKFTK